MRTASLTQEKQGGFYQNMVIGPASLRKQLQNSLLCSVTTGMVTKDTGYPYLYSRY